MGLLKEGSVTILAPRSTALYGVEYFHAEIQRQAQPQAAGAPLPPPPPPPPRSRAARPPRATYIIYFPQTRGGN